MSRPDDPFEAVSYDLNRFRERRMAERRAAPRPGSERRAQHPEHDDRQQSAPPQQRH